jgi:PEP-CTERM motif
MRADRIFPKLASLGATLALCLFATGPVRADLIWGAPVFNAAESTTSIDLVSTAELTGVGFDYFILSLLHPPEVVPLSVAAGAALPEPNFPTPGWSVGGIINDAVQVDYVGSGDLEGILPPGQLLTFTFAGLSTPDVVASFLPYNLSDEQLLDEPVRSNSPVPEPASWMLMFAGLMGLALVGARRRTQSLHK